MPNENKFLCSKCGSETKDFEMEDNSIFDAIVTQGMKFRKCVITTCANVDGYKVVYPGD